MSDPSDVSDPMEVDPEEQLRTAARKALVRKRKRDEDSYDPDSDSSYDADDEEDRQEKRKKKRRRVSPKSDGERDDEREPRQRRRPDHDIVMTNVVTDERPKGEHHRLIDDRDFIGHPVWAPADATAGGTRVEAVLGPGCKEYGFYSPVTGGGKLKAWQLATAKYGSYKFVCGHLLNSNFGGQGDEAENLTVLTVAANKQQEDDFDSRLKEAIDLLNKAYHELFHLAPDMVITMQYGIAIEVVTVGRWRSNKPNNVPECYIPKGLKCRAWVFEPPTWLQAPEAYGKKAGRARSALFYMDSLRLLLDDLYDVDVDNT